MGVKPITEVSQTGNDTKSDESNNTGSLTFGKVSERTK